MKVTMSEDLLELYLTVVSERPDGIEIILIEIDDTHYGNK